MKVDCTITTENNVYECHWHGRRGGWQFQAEDFDGGPWIAGGPPMDKRYGYGATIADVIDEIREIETNL